MRSKRKGGRDTGSNSYDDVRTALMQARKEVESGGPRARMIASALSSGTSPIVAGGTAAPAASGRVTSPPMVSLGGQGGAGLSRSSADRVGFPSSPLTQQQAPHLSSAHSSPLQQGRMTSPTDPKAAVPRGKGSSALGPSASSQWWGSVSGGPAAVGASHPPPFPSAFEGRTPASPNGCGPVSNSSGEPASYRTPSPPFTAPSPQQKPSALPSLALLVGGGAGGGAAMEGLRSEGAFVDGFSVRNRPLLPETIRDAVHMYLESSGRHDVVVAMLRAEKAATAHRAQEPKEERAVSKKAHDILKRGLMERSMADHAKSPADVVRGVAAAGLLSSYVLPTLYGFEEAVQPDLVLLYAAIEEKLLSQYAQLGLPPPPLEVRRYLVSQTKQPMWSATDVADATFLPRASNLNTGNVFYGTVNQLIEELTRVYVVPLATVPERLVTAGQQFQDTFFRQHRLFLPSSVLLAKLMERFFVPFALKLHPEDFSVHGITIHAPRNGSSVPLARSQGETVYRGTEKIGSGGGGPGKDTVFASATSFSPASPVAGASGSFESSARSPLFGPGSPTNLAESRRTPPGGWAADGGGAHSPPGWSGEERRWDDPGGGGGGGAAATKHEVPVKLVTHYSKSGSLWLMVCEKIQTKVLTVLLQWLTAHPSHFDEEMVHSLLHFVELCCYSPSRFSDCPSKFTQIAEFVRTNCYNVLRKLRKRAAAATAAASAKVPLPTTEVNTSEAGMGFAQSHQLPLPQHGGQISSALPPSMTLCSFALDERKKAFEDAIPPPLRRSHPTMHTWRSHVDTKEADFCLSLFTMRHRSTPDEFGLRRFMASSAKSTDHRVASGGGPDWVGCPPEALGQEHVDPLGLGVGCPVSPGAHSRASLAAGGSGGGSSPLAGSASMERYPANSPPYPMLLRARRALDLFAAFSLEEYVKGLTAAHQTLFALFPAPDLLVAALHTTANFQTSRTFQGSYLGGFLRTSTELTQWTASLLLHAAFLDGEQRSARACQAASTGGPTTATAANSEADAAAPGAGTAPPHAFLKESVDRPPGLGGHGAGNHYSSAASSALGDAYDRALDSLASGEDDDDDVGLTYNVMHDDNDDDNIPGGSGSDSNATANRSSFHTSGGPHEVHFEDEAAVLRRSYRLSPAEARRLSLGAAPAQRFMNVLGRVVDLVVGFLRVNNLHASYSVFRGLSHPFVKKLLQHPTMIAHMEPHTGHQLRKLHILFARPEHMARRARHKSSPQGEGGGPNFSGAHQDMTLGEYMQTLSDSAEFPTIPAVLYYLRELQRIHATEPTFLTKTLDEVYPRGDHNRHREESTGADGSSITPVCIVHWRKLRMLDEIVQTVSALQTAALYDLSSRATVVHFAAVNEKLERGFSAQLEHTIVKDVQTQQEMGNKLLAML